MTPCCCRWVIFHDPKIIASALVSWYNSLGMVHIQRNCNLIVRITIKVTHDGKSSGNLLTATVQEAWQTCPDPIVIHLHHPEIVRSGGISRASEHLGNRNLIATIMIEVT